MLEAMWKANEGQVLADVAEIRSQGSKAATEAQRLAATAAAGEQGAVPADGNPDAQAAMAAQNEITQVRKKGRRGAVTNENPQLHKIEEALKEFKDLLAARTEPEAAWEAYRALMTAVKEKPPISNEELAAMLRNVSFFANTTEEFLAELIKALKQARFSAGEMLMYAGEIGREMYLITAGEVEILAGEDSRVVAELSVGAFFGEIALLKNSKRTASARTRTACNMCVLFKKDFTELVDKHPDMRAKIWEAAAEKSLRTSEALFNREVAKKVPLFAGCPEAFFRRLVDKMEPKMVAAGETVIQQGETGREMYILNEGTCEVSVKDMESGNVKVIAVIESGSFFGESALLRNEPRNASITTLSPVVLCRLDKVHFEEILNEFPQVRKKLVDFVNKTAKGGPAGKGKK